MDNAVISADCTNKLMTEMPDNILHLPEYQVLGFKSTDDEMHFQVDPPNPIACE